MSKRAATKNRAERPTKRARAAGPETHWNGGSVGAHGLYLYCVGEADALVPLLGAGMPTAIEETSGIELVEAGGLAAVVSLVPLADYGEDALPERLTDPAWTAARALGHERVVRHFAARTAIVPLRFGTIFLGRDSIERMLEEEGDSLREQLRLVEGHDEWGINLYVERAALREGVGQTSPVLREMSERADRLPPGQAYLLRKKIETLRDSEAREERKRVVSAVLDQLGRACAASGRLRPTPGEATEHGELAAKLVFLVERERFDSFRAEAERAAEGHAPLGFRFELTGPWPAYNFVGRGMGVWHEPSGD
jgi:hypothetical protein